MNVLVLAAGRGERMRPLTDSQPKPLLSAGGDTLIGHLLRALCAAGHRRFVINHSHLGQLIEDRLGDGHERGIDICYSPEPPGALETGGGILNALPLLNSDPFAVVNGDIWTDYPFGRLPDRIEGLAHVVLVDNPPHNEQGDFVLCGSTVRNNPATAAGTALTFAGIGVYRRALFADCRPGRFPLVDLLRGAADAGGLTGEHYPGRWFDIGTPQRLADLDEMLERESENT